LALADSSDSGTPVQESVHATFLAFDAANAQVSYVLPSGQARTSRVSSADALVKMAKMRAGQQVVLKCGPGEVSGRCSVEAVKKKANWLKRGIILVAIIVTVGHFVDSMGTL
jgi:hypothetical protein